MNSQAVAESIATILTDNFDLDQDVTPATRFSEIELDSLIMLELSVIIERKYGIKIAEDELVEAGSVAGVVALMESRSSVDTPAD
ncbi:acyl carrier protein [Streptomyces sp. V4I2]|uniref:acyl carrier protein n=1 Tax=Streptomyces sp. V4I2 TaxID=3042280 RepID=UPI00277DDDDD|nr:acyl carrier protein [Streptomyces sp. V4I2]MDQ1047468.1 acyl carrier protein [Streptomyces sp. V4I2]